ncbi:thioesterase II family protein [Kitasatospora sp. NPDC006697]|uniref:thioesterase II family protein n=1 Tax=Kitasatospora sp. NPDC006697 TaxID=3364020 RepID=UPI0036AC32DD
MRRTAPGRSAWLPYPAAAQAAPLRLFCLPHAGGGATAYRSWVRQPDGRVEVVPVQPPGRESRRSEPRPDTVAMLVRELAAALLPWLDAPFALLGNSMGSVVAFELARYLAERHGRSPEHLFVAASAAPHCARPNLPRFDLLSDGELIAFLADRYRGIPEALLRSPELLALFTPVLRADLELLRGYRPGPLPVLSCPVTAFIGAGDPLPRELVDQWRAVTIGPFERVELPGGHFALLEEGSRVIELLGKAAPR